MKMFSVNGTIKCGHRLFNLEKFIIAHDEAEATAIYKASRPDAKFIKTTYRHDVGRYNTKGIFRNDILTRIEEEQK